MLKLANAALRTAALLLPFAALIALYRYLFAAFPASWVMTDTVFVICAVVVILMLRLAARPQTPIDDHAPEITAMFEAFAQRHRLAVNVDGQDVKTYTYEAGDRLKHWLVLSLVEDDDIELDFGDYQFRYFYQRKTRDSFERMLDDWICGKARIAVYSGGGQVLETATDSGWAEFTRMNVGPLRGKPVEIVANAP